MNDYMIALLERFRIETPELSAYRARTHAAENKLKETLDDNQRKLLLQLVDCSNLLLEESALCGFLSGWRLVSGIRNELDWLPRFSIAAEDEAIAQFLYGKKKVSLDGKEKCERRGQHPQEI